MVDPSAYFFHKAVCEHALMLKDKADASIDRLLVDVTDAPERYRMVAALMHFDMVTWQEKDLGWIARKMDNIQRRLDLKRGGKNTQKQQKEVLVRLDEMIKEIENKQKSSGGSGATAATAPAAAASGPDAPGTDKSSNPQQDTQGGIGQRHGPGGHQEGEGDRRGVGQAPREGTGPGPARADPHHARQGPRRHRGLLQGAPEEVQPSEVSEH